MDWLYKLSIYISIVWGLNSENQTKGIHAELAAFLSTVGSKI